DVVFSSSPDGGVHNTYNRVEFARFNLSPPIKSANIIVTGPLGEMTFGLDALRLADGSIIAVYLGGLHVYSDIAPDIEKRRGIFAALSHDRQHWTVSRITESTGTAQLRLR